MRDDCRDLYVCSLRPRNVSVPSYRPRHTPGSTVKRCPVRRRLGGGAAHGNSRQLLPCEQERESVSHHREGSGIVPSNAPGRSETPSLLDERAFRVSGSSHGCPVRRHAHLLPSLHRARIFSSQRRPVVSACQRRHVLIGERRWTMPCPCRALSPILPGISVLRDDPASRRQRLRTRPM